MSEHLINHDETLTAYRTGDQTGAVAGFRAVAAVTHSDYLNALTPII
jgi:hypothetical protein